MSLNFMGNGDGNDDDTPSTANTEAVEVMTQTMREMNLILQRLDTGPADNNRDEILRSVLSEIEPWDPDTAGAMCVTSFFANFDMVAADFSSQLKYRLLIAKTRGAANQFLIDRDDSLDTDNVYEAARTDMIRWFQEEDPQHAAALLWTVRRSSSETLRQFADRVRNLARCAVMEEGKTFGRSERNDWVEKKTLRAFIRGVEKQMSTFLITNQPSSIQDALEKAKELEETLETTPEVNEKWELAAVGGEQRCYSNGNLSHYAKEYPKKHESLSGHKRRNNEREPKPHFPCMFCADLTHFPVACSFDPQKMVFCDYCGIKEHLERNCYKKKKRLPVSQLVMEPTHTMEDAQYKSPPEDVHIPVVEAQMSRTLKITVGLGPDSLTLSHAGSSEVEGVTTSVHEGDALTLDNGDLSYDNKCYCSASSGCPPTGARNVAKCRFGAPAYISYPHFYLADGSYAEKVTGMNASEEHHKLTISLDKITGIPLEVHARLQINILAESVPGLRFFNGLPGAYMPMLWFDQRARITSNLAGELRESAS
ncbi:hypothetical protein GE061_013770 [Apolygus lucorum]|uniref:Retrotransposon gag domain-containing protein n=1 Tax=Apolygus lucorum TaxID=248454 RepID=A0A8S9XNX8_APOLU|nr:hypothetical protein GE061_013770 [Apolygus lucorum]